MRRNIEVRVEEEVLAAIRGIAEEHFPNEAGGSLMGYRNDEDTEITVTGIVGPGPAAIHGPVSFRPDYPYQETEIGRMYVESNRTHTYLGDWHSHPEGSSTLSSTDYRALRNIASFPEARASQPIMILLSGRPGRWVTTIWQLRGKRLRAANLLSQIT